MNEQVTKEQLDFFRLLYEEEERTSLQLEGRAKVYLGVISAVLAAILLKASDAKGIADALHIPWVLLLAEALAMTVGLLLVLWALRIRNFEAVNDGERLLEQYAGDWPNGSRFNEDRVVDYAVASSKNRKLNSETAAVLAWASRSMATGILLLLGVVLFAIRRA